MPRLRLRDMGTALQTAATNDTVDIGAASFLSGKPFSVGVWIYRINSRFMIASIGFDNATDKGFLIRDSTDNRVRVYAGATSTTFDSVLPMNKWVHVVVTYDGSSVVQCFVNGQLDGTRTRTPHDIVGNFYWFAEKGVTADKNKYDEAFVIDRVLSQSEVQAAMDGRFPSDTKGLYKFDEGSGLVANDSSGNSRTGTIVGATYTTDVPLKARTATSGRLKLRSMNASLALPGVGSGVIANTIPNLDTGCSFSVWFKDILADSTARTLIENSISSSQRIGLVISSNVVRAGFYNGTAYTSKASGVLRPREWHHALFTWDGSAAMLYVDGVSQSDTTSLPSTSAGGGLGIGRRGDAATASFGGLLAQAVIWNRPLSASEAQQVYLTGINPAGVVANFNLDEGTGTTANDTSGNGNNGTITNGAWSTDVPIAPRVASTRTAAA